MGIMQVEHMIFHLKILLDIMFSGYNVSPNRVSFYFV